MKRALEKLLKYKYTLKIRQNDLKILATALYSFQRQISAYVNREDLKKSISFQFEKLVAQLNDL